MPDAGQWMEITDALSDADRMIHEIVAVTQGVVRGHSGRVAILDAYNPLFSVIAVMRRIWSELHVC